MFRILSLGMFVVAIVLFYKGQTTNALCFIILSNQMFDRYEREKRNFKW